MESPLRRGLSHARGFPRPFWAVVVGGASNALGGGVLVPYWGLYLTGTLHLSGARAGLLPGLAGGMGPRRRSARRRETRPALGEGESTRGYVTRCATDACCCWLLTLGTGIGVVVYVQFDSVLGVFLHLDRGYALATWGAVFAISPVLVAVFQFAVSRWAGRRSARAMLAGAVVVARSRRRGPPAWSPTLALPLSLVAALCFRRLPADYAVRPCAAPSS